MLQLYVGQAYPSIPSWTLRVGSPCVGLERLGVNVGS